jgi:hypothetical protein
MIQNMNIRIYAGQIVLIIIIEYIQTEKDVLKKNLEKLFIMMNQIKPINNVSKLAKNVVLVGMNLIIIVMNAL